MDPLAFRFRCLMYHNITVMSCHEPEVGFGRGLGLSLGHRLCEKKKRMKKGTPAAYEFTSLLVYKPRPKKKKLNQLRRLHDVPRPCRSHHLYRGKRKTET